MARKNRNVGLIGLGIIGSRAAAGLRAAGFPVFVWNRTPQPTPNFLGSPAAVAELCEIIQIFVSDADAVFGVIEAMGDRLTPNHVIICSATIGHEATLEAARFVEHHGARFLDAPFTGSKVAAEKRQLTYYVGGDEATLERARPVLEATSKSILPMGKIGDAATVKVVTNMIAAVSIEAMSEAFALTRKAGIAPDLFAAALAQNACRSGTMDLKLPKMMDGDYSPHFSLKHMFKDVQLGIQMARALEVDLPAATVTGGVMYGAINHGWGDLDFASVFKLYEQALENPKPAGTLPAAPPPAEPLLEEELLEVVAAVPPDAKPATENEAPSSPS